MQQPPPTSQDALAPSMASLSVQQRQPEHDGVEQAQRTARAPPSLRPVRFPRTAVVAFRADHRRLSDAPFVEAFAALYGACEQRTASRKRTTGTIAPAAQFDFELLQPRPDSFLVVLLAFVRYERHRFEPGRSVADILHQASWVDVEPVGGTHAAVRHGRPLANVAACDLAESGVFSVPDARRTRKDDAGVRRKMDRRECWRRVL